MEDSIFTKIIKGEIPCHKVYEDAKTIVFMDIHPVQPGMCLVVPKAQISNFYDLPDADYQALWSTVKKTGKALRTNFPDKKRIGVQVQGLDVDHVHVKMFPVDTGEEFRFKPNLDSEPNHPELAELAKKLASQLG